MALEAKNQSLLATDQSNSVLHAGHHSMTYSPFGYCQNLVTAASGFSGEVFDPVMGGYLLGNGYRNFSPEIQRFHTPDSLSPFGAGGINAYVYCEGDPLNYIDPSGHIKFLKGLRKLFNFGGKSAKKTKSLDNLTQPGKIKTPANKLSKSTNNLYAPPTSNIVNPPPTNLGKSAPAPSKKTVVLYEKTYTDGAGVEHRGVFSYPKKRFTPGGNASRDTNSGPLKRRSSFNDEEMKELNDILIGIRTDPT